MTRRLISSFAARLLFRQLFVTLCALVACGGLSGQTLLNGPGGAPNLPGTDLAVLEAREPRRDLLCTVTPQKPSLGFDLRFHSGFDITVPLKDLAGSDNTLTVLFRVSLAAKPDSPVYFVKSFNVPPIEDDARGEANLQGSFDLGEGKYQVDWLMKDRAERVCSSYWDAEAVLGPKDKSVALTLDAGEIAPTDLEPFEPQPFTTRSEGTNGLNLKVLVNFAPQNAQASTLQQTDTSAIRASGNSPSSPSTLRNRRSSTARKASRRSIFRPSGRPSARSIWDASISPAWLTRTARPSSSPTCWCRSSRLPISPMPSSSSGPRPWSRNRSPPTSSAPRPAPISPFFT
jgi:hypothetical protein